MNNTQTVLNMLRDAISGSEFDGRLFIAGGFVRDTVMGNDPKDIDIVVDGGLDSGIEAATFIATKLGVFREDSNPVIFPRFGTAKLTVFVNNEQVDVEFVAPRKEVYDGVSRKPTVSAGSLIDDAMRRDFTINALFENLVTGEILDLTGRGMADIRNGVIETTGDADWIFNEDPLRIIRAVRFAVKFKFIIKIETLRAIRRNADTLNRISNERIQDELSKILVLNEPSFAFHLFEDTGILKVILPELQNLVGLTQNKFHHEDAFNHTLSVLDGTPNELIRRLGALFHDTGKFATRTEKDGKVQFIGHQMVSAQIANDVLRRLKFSNDVIEKVAAIARFHMDLKPAGDDSMGFKDKTLRKFIHRVGENLDPLLDVIHADNTAHSETHSMPNQIRRVRDRLANMDIVAIQNTKSILDGNQIMALGCSGKIISQIKNRIVEKMLENPDFSEDQAVNLAKNMISSGKV